LVREITILKKNVEQAEQEKELLKSEGTETQDLKYEIATLQAALATANYNTETMSTQLEDLSEMAKAYKFGEALANENITEMIQKVGESLSKRKLSAELNGSLMVNPNKSDTQAELLENLGSNIDSLLLEYEYSRQENIQLNSDNTALAQEKSDLNTELLNNNLLNLQSEAPELEDNRNHIKVLEARVAELESAAQVESQRADDLKSFIQESGTKEESRIAALENELTENLLKFEERECELREKWKADVDRLTSDSLTGCSGFKISDDQNDGSAVLKQNHQRIVCDTCLDVHIYGSRFKSFGENFNDICEKCYPLSEHQDPVLEWKAPCGITPEKLEDLMPYFKILLAEIQNGRCKVHANNGFNR